jgi:hypothetical protein
VLFFSVAGKSRRPAKLFHRCTWNPFNHTADSLVFVYLRQYLHYDLQTWPILCVNTSANLAKWIGRGDLTTYRTSAVQRYVTNLLHLSAFVQVCFRSIITSPSIFALRPSNLNHLKMILTWIHCHSCCPCHCFCGCRLEGRSPNIHRDIPKLQITLAQMQISKPKAKCPCVTLHWLRSLVSRNLSPNAFRLVRDCKVVHDSWQRYWSLLMLMVMGMMMMT